MTIPRHAAATPGGAAVPLTVTRIAHASQLITFGDLRVLTDPWFTQTATYHHGEPVSHTVAALGRVDAPPRRSSGARELTAYPDGEVLRTAFHRPLA